MGELSSGGSYRGVLGRMRYTANPTAEGFADRAASPAPEAAEPMPDKSSTVSDGTVTDMMSRLRATYYPGDGSGIEPSPPGAGSQLAYVSRCAVLQAIGAAFIAGLWIAGIAGKPFEGDNAFLCWLIVGIAGLGILCLFLQRWKDVEWIATHVVRIGLLGTVVGLIIAFSAAGSGGSSDPEEVRKMIATVVGGMYVSLYATLLGITANLWLKINLRLLGGHHG